MSTQGTTYKPTENDGKKVDGTDDARVSSEHGFGSRRDQASEAGKIGGQKGGKTSDLDPEAPERNDGDFNPDAPEV